MITHEGKDILYPCYYFAFLDCHYLKIFGIIMSEYGRAYLIQNKKLLISSPWSYFFNEMPLFGVG